MTLYRKPTDAEMFVDEPVWDETGMVPVDASRVFTVGNPWDNEVWLPSLFDKGDRVIIVKIRDDDE